MSTISVGSFNKPSVIRFSDFTASLLIVDYWLRKQQCNCRTMMKYQWLKDFKFSDLYDCVKLADI